MSAETLGETGDAESFVAPKTDGQETLSTPSLRQEIRSLGKSGHADERQVIAGEYWEQKKDLRAEQAIFTETEAQLTTLRQEIEDAEANTITRFFSILERRGKSQEVTRLEAAQESRAQKIEGLSEFKQHTQKRIEQHYTQLRQEWSELPYDRQEVEKYFTTDYLQNLSLDDYMQLLRRFPASLLTHVTRQGVRDHSGMMEHTAGVGEIHNGMKDLFKDGYLRSALGRLFTEMEVREAVTSFFQQHITYHREKVSWTQEESERKIALDLLESLIGEAYKWGGYGDKTAVHLGLNAVLDDYYGAEVSNECFIVWPTALPANEYRFAGLGNNDSEIDKNNDVWVLAKEKDGVNLNAGIIFLPDAVEVDPETGSRYQVDAESKPIYHQDFLAQLESALGNPEVFAALQGVINYQYPREQRPTYQEVGEKLATIGITNDKLIDAIITRPSDSIRALVTLGQDRYNDPDSFSSPVQQASIILKEIRSEYQEAQTTIPAREYWEQYFAKNPDQRPSRVFYYNGSPTEAVRSLMASYEISYYPGNNWKKTGQVRELFPDKGGEDEDFRTRQAAFEELAKNVIDQIYPEDSEVTS